MLFLLSSFFATAAGLVTPDNVLKSYNTHQNCYIAGSVFTGCSILSGLVATLVTSLVANKIGDAQSANSTNPLSSGTNSYQVSVAGASTAFAGAVFTTIAGALNRSASQSYKNYMELHDKLAEREASDPTVPADKKHIKGEYLPMSTAASAF